MMVIDWLIDWLIMMMMILLKLVTLDPDKVTVCHVILWQDCSQYQDSREAHCAVWNDLNIRSGYHVWLPYQSSKGMNA